MRKGRYYNFQSGKLGWKEDHPTGVKRAAISNLRCNIKPLRENRINIELAIPSFL
jgi:hypothetical protein